MLKKLWHDPVWSKVIAAIITAAGVGVVTFISNRADWFEGNVEVNRLTVIVSLLILVPANLWWLIRLFKAVLGKFAGEAGEESAIAFEPNEKEKNILSFLFKTPSDRTLDEIYAEIGFNNAQEGFYHVMRLAERGYVRRPLKSPKNMAAVNGYNLTQSGREFVLTNQLHRISISQPRENDRPTGPREFEPDKVAQKILRLFGEYGQTEVPEDSIRMMATNVDTVTFDFHFNELQEKGFIEYSHRDIMEGHFYQLTQKGRKFLIDDSPGING